MVHKLKGLYHGWGDSLIQQYIGTEYEKVEQQSPPKTVSTLDKLGTKIATRIVKVT